MLENYSFYLYTKNKCSNFYFFFYEIVILFFEQNISLENLKNIKNYLLSING